jgi:hypothetical protein
MTNVPAKPWRLRLDAALRCAPISDAAGLAARDPWVEPRIDEPATYGLTLTERRAHGTDLHDRHGWSWAEVAQRLDLHRVEAA